jgi:tRNA1(Val) A37 N6-methylase TrmN6
MIDPVKVDFLDKLVKRWKKEYKTERQHMVARYEAFQLYYGTINQFRPAVAKWVYCLLGAKQGILDFSAGWGGRCLAAVSLGIPYIGFDTNKNLESSYKRMIRFVDPGANATLIFKSSETADFSKFKYDLIFTSPPYFMIEKYEKMPMYESKHNFLETFFRPVVLNAWKHLSYGGRMALNMPTEMYEDIRSILPPLEQTLVLPLHNRHPVNAVLKQSIGAEKDAYGEYIYVWHKVRKQTRRKKSTKKHTRKNSRQ